MIKSKNIDAEIITTEVRLQELVSHLMSVSEIAVDLEMDSLHNYKEKVCLIQISTRTDSWLIDPLELPSVNSLAKPLGDKDILVVMHGADYDIRSMYRDFGIEINNLFDTMIAARFLGLTEFGLAALLKSRFDIQLDKKYQKADWSIRPLSPEMCRYAAEDTSMLLLLYDQLKTELLSLKRLDYVEEESNLLCGVRVAEKNGPLFLSCKRAGKLSSQSLTILEPLLQLRDLYAKKLNRPPFKVISAETLIEISEKKPRTIVELAMVKGITPGQINRFGAEIINVVVKALETPKNEMLHYPKTVKIENRDGYKERLKRLKEWREEYSKTFLLDPGLLAPNWLLEAVSEQQPAVFEDLTLISNMRNWQKQLYGAELLQQMMK